MLSAGELLPLLSRALDQTDVIISRVTPDQAALPTPDRAWNVRQLVNHTVHDVQQFIASASGAWWEPSAADVIGDDWSGAYRKAADDLLAAWNLPGALERSLDLPVGEFPAEWRIGQQISDLAVHGWDIAVATGQSTKGLDPEIATFSLEWAQQNLMPQFRGDEASGKAFGPKVSCPDDAPIYDRLAAFFGRDPSTW
jgi:uncharacterized protein (TIGR03086 family)